MKKYLLLGVVLLALIYLSQPEKGLESHSFQFEPVIFPCNELGCLTGKSADAERCQCGGVDMMRDLPCAGSRQCQCGADPCACGKYCNDTADPCTTLQECKLIQPEKPPPQSIPVPLR